MERLMRGCYEHIKGIHANWYIPVDRNPNSILVESDDSQGYYGHTVVLQMKDGSECRLHGPWNSNKEAFERDTEISY